MNETSGSHPLVKLAREAITSHLTGGVAPEPEPFDGYDRPAGAFVSLKKEGQLRGCIGTIGPVRPSVALEVIDNAVSAATRDPRFSPLSLEELGQVTISVDVLGEPEPVQSIDDLDPSRFGVIVRSGPRKGVLLPDLPGVDTPQDQVRIASQKAGIGTGEPVELFRFEVKRYT